MQKRMPTRIKKKRKGDKVFKKHGRYFTADTERSIIAYQNEEDHDTKVRIFTEEIQPAFTKLVENLIFVYKFHYYGNVKGLKNDCISFLYESMHKFDGTRGFKAFSYFNVMAKNYFIQRVKDYKKVIASSVELDKDLLTQLEKEDENMAIPSYEDEVIQEEFLFLLREEVKSWRDKFHKDQEKKVLEAINLLMDNMHLVSVYNKKSIYLYLRDISGLNTKQVVTNLRKFRRKYSAFKKNYEDGQV